MGIFRTKVTIVGLFLHGFFTVFGSQMTSAKVVRSVRECSWGYRGALFYSQSEHFRFWVYPKGLILPTVLTRPGSLSQVVRNHSLDYHTYTRKGEAKEVG